MGDLSVKKWFISTIFILNVVLLAGCGKTNDANGVVNTQSEEIDLSYNQETDSQSKRCNEAGAFTADGKYYFDYSGSAAGKVLMFTDAKSGQTVPVCSKSNCSHSGEGCDAYFTNEEYPLPDIYYYEGNLYMPKLFGDYIGFEKVALDGTVREESIKIMRFSKNTIVMEDGTESESIYYPEMALHRGYVYYSDYYPGCTECGLYRLALDDNQEAEMLFEQKDDNPTVYRVKPYGNVVFFQAGKYGNSVDTLDIGMYMYNINSGEVQEIIDDAMRYYAVSESSVYYITAEGINEYDVETGEISKFCDLPADINEGIPDVFYKDDELIYEMNYNSGQVTQYRITKDGKASEISAADWVEEY